MEESIPPEHHSSPQTPDLSKIQPVLEFVKSRRGAAGAWLVGGCVRDLLLQRDSNDVDLVVSQGAISLARELANAFSGGFFVMDGERDVARAVVRDPDGRNLNVDIAHLRASELQVDLSLRDFTVNAMALSLPDLMSDGHKLSFSQIVDPFDGRTDLDQGVIRVVTEGAFPDDPLRMLRAIRQASELGFRIEDATYNLIRRDASLLTTVASERVRDELWQLLSVPGGWHQIRVLLDTCLLVYCLPEAAATVGITQSAPHYQDVFDHTRSAMAHLERLYELIWCNASWRVPQSGPADSLPMLDQAAWEDVTMVIRPYVGELQAHLCGNLAAGRDRRGWLLWAALAHDWGKPAVRSVGEDGEIHFLGHAERGAAMAQARLRALRTSVGEMAYVSRLVEMHMRPGYLSHEYPPSRRAVYRFFQEAAGCGPDCVLLSLADYAAIRAGNPFLEPWAHRLATAGVLLQSYFREREERVEPTPLLNGTQIMSALGLISGPQIGRLLAALREAQAAGDITDREEALDWLAKQVR